MVTMFDLEAVIQTIGYAGLFGIIFSESGLLIGLFLPGDSLLFTAGFLASQGFFEIATLVGLTFFAAVLGDSAGYTFGYLVGPRIFKREDSILFHKDYLERAKDFYDRHGGKTILLARFMPIVRTFAPIIAGVGKMKYSTFLFYNILGGAAWAIGFPMLGFYVGNMVPHADRFILPIIALIIFSSFLPPIIQIMKNAENRKKFKDLIGEKIRKLF